MIHTFKKVLLYILDNRFYNVTLVVENFCSKSVLEKWFLDLTFTDFQTGHLKVLTFKVIFHCQESSELFWGFFSFRNMYQFRRFFLMTSICDF